MKKDVKVKMIVISLLGLLLGRILNRVLPSYFGDNSSNIIMVVVLVSIFCLILISVVMKYYLTAIWIAVIFIPALVCGVGIYRNNADLILVGIVLIGIVFGISAKVIPKFANKNK